MSADRFLPPRAYLFFRPQDQFELTFRSNDEFEIKSMEGEARLFRRAEPWTPASTDIQAVEGRYQSEDVDKVFEVLPGTNGIRLRLEGSPDKAIDLEPVTRDTYMQQDDRAMSSRRERQGHRTRVRQSGGPESPVHSPEGRDPVILRCIILTRSNQEPHDARAESGVPHPALPDHQ